MIFASEPPEQGQHGVEAGMRVQVGAPSAYLVGDGVLAATSRLAECPASVNYAGGPSGWWAVSHVDGGNDHSSPHHEHCRWWHGSRRSRQQENRGERRACLTISLWENGVRTADSLLCADQSVTVRALFQYEPRQHNARARSRSSPLGGPGVVWFQGTAKTLSGLEIETHSQTTSLELPETRS